MKYLFSLLLLLLLLAPLFLPATAWTAPPVVVSGSGSTDLNTIDPLQSSSHGTTPKGKPLHGKRITNVIELISVLVWAFPSIMSAAALLMVIIAGFLMVTAAGNDEKIERAKTQLFYIVVGMGALLMAYAIIWFVIFRITNTPTTPLTSSPQ